MKIDFVEGEIERFQSHESNLMVDTKRWSAGIYFVHIHNNHQKYAYRIVKN